MGASTDSFSLEERRVPPSSLFRLVPRDQKPFVRKEERVGEKRTFPHLLEEEEGERGSHPL